MALEEGKSNIAPGNLTDSRDNSVRLYKETTPNVTSFPTTIQQHKHEQQKISSMKNSDVPNQLASSVPLVGEPEETVHSQVLFSQDEILSGGELDFPSVSKSTKSVQNRHSKENIPYDVGRTPCATASKRNNTLSSNISRRLYEHKRKRY
jgi:hypothetical protein